MFMIAWEIRRDQQRQILFPNVLIVGVIRNHNNGILLATPQGMLFSVVWHSSFHFNVLECH
jgi:hypothetical protein